MMTLGYPNMTKIMSAHGFEELGYASRRIKNMLEVR
jgi:hypothetical protein